MASRGKKILIGCGLGCAGALVLAVGSCIGFGVWINRPGELLEPGRLLGPDTAGFVEWRLRMEDPGTQQIVERAIELSQTDAEELGTALPPWVSRVLASRQSSSNEKAIRQMLPAVAAWSVRAGERPDDDLHLLTVSVRGLGNRIVLVDWVLGMVFHLSDDVVAVPHGGERIYELPLHANRSNREVFAFFLRNASIVVASDVETARQAVDRLAAEGTAGPYSPTDVERQFDRIPESFPLRGAISNRRGELGRVWNLLTDGPRDDWTGVLSATLQARFVEGTDLAGTLELDCRDEDWARANAERLTQQLVDELDSTWFEARSEVDGEHILVEFRATDVLSRLD